MDNFEVFHVVLCFGTICVSLFSSRLFMVHSLLHSFIVKLRFTIISLNI